MPLSNGSRRSISWDTTSLDSLDKKPDDFRSRKPSAPATRPDHANLVIKTFQCCTTLEKTGDKWFITAPVQARANATAAEEIIREMTNISINGFSQLKRWRCAAPLAGCHGHGVCGRLLRPPHIDCPGFRSRFCDQAGAQGHYAGHGGVYGYHAEGQCLRGCAAGSDQVFTLRTDAFNHLNRDLKDLRVPTSRRRSRRRAT